MATRSVLAVADKLVNKFGFALDEDAGDAHIFYSRQVDGVGKVSTHFSHGEKEIRDVLIRAVAGQLRVNGAYFKNMLDCKNSCGARIEQIRENPVGPLARFHDPRKK